MKQSKKTIEIGGIIYKVIYRPRKKFAKDLAIKGSIDFSTREIEIERGLSPSEEIQVLIHEICHGVLDSFVPAKLLDSLSNTAFGNLEELIVDPFSRILVGALRSADLLKE